MGRLSVQAQCADVLFRGWDDDFQRAILVRQQLAGKGRCAAASGCRAQRV
jgi:hypothetical protein